MIQGDAPRRTPEKAATYYSPPRAPVKGDRRAKQREQGPAGGPRRGWRSYLLNYRARRELDCGGWSVGFPRYEVRRLRCVRAENDEYSPPHEVEAAT